MPASVGNLWVPWVPIFSRALPWRAWLTACTVEALLLRVQFSFEWLYCCNWQYCVVFDVVKNRWIKVSSLKWKLKIWDLIFDLPLEWLEDLRFEENMGFEIWLNDWNQLLNDLRLIISVMFPAWNDIGYRVYLEQMWCLSSVQRSKFDLIFWLIILIFQIPVL